MQTIKIGVEIFEIKATHCKFCIFEICVLLVIVFQRKWLMKMANPKLKVLRFQRWRLTHYFMRWVWYIRLAC